MALQHDCQVVDDRPFVPDCPGCIDAYMNGFNRGQAGLSEHVIEAYEIGIVRGQERERKRTMDRLAHTDMTLGDLAGLDL